MKQLSLFDAPSPYRVTRSESLGFNAPGLMRWKERIFDYQQTVLKGRSPQQQTLFELTANHWYSSPDHLDPFSLNCHSSLFWRQKPSAELEAINQGCLYFIIDRTMPLLLYIGETKLTAQQRWRGTHYCKEYILRYLELHRRYDLEVAIVSAFCPLALSKKMLQTWERELILKWRSPFNKECWQWWGQPFGKTCFDNIYGPS
ncbi:MAG: GIY-YIG nuclease family protein [Microcystaceae cyanobacterium]